MSANRQEDNARVFEKEGAAKVILNEELNGANLSETINEMIKDKQKLIKMGENARKMAIYDVEDKIYEEIEKWFEIKLFQTFYGFYKILLQIKKTLNLLSIVKTYNKSLSKIIKIAKIVVYKNA